MIKNSPDFDRPPKTEEVLAAIAQKWLGGKYVYRADDRIPRDPFDLARWWMKNQSPPKEPYDRPTQHNRRDGSGTFWRTPYAEWLRHTLINFVHIISYAILYPVYPHPGQ